jgi:hypothetical protein
MNVGHHAAPVTLRGAESGELTQARDQAAQPLLADGGRWVGCEARTAAY